MIADPCPSTPSTRRVAPPTGQQAGQATLEFVAIVPLLVLAALACAQGLCAALTLVYAQAGAEAAARQPQLTAHSLPAPGAWRRSARISRRGDRVTVSMKVPSVLPTAGWRLHSDTAAEVPA